MEAAKDVNAPVTVPTLSFAHRKVVFQMTAGEAHGKTIRVQPHTQAAMTLLCNRARVASHEELSVSIQYTGLISHVKLMLWGVWTDSDSPVTDVGSEPSVVHKCISAAQPIAEFPCDFQEFISRSIRPEPIIGGHPVFVFKTVVVDEHPEYAVDGKSHKRAMPKEVRLMDVFMGGRLKVGALTSAMMT